MEQPNNNIAEFTGTLVDRQYEIGQKYVQLVFETAEGLRLAITRDADKVKALCIGNDYHVRGIEQILQNKLFLHEPNIVNLLPKLVKEEVSFLNQHKWKIVSASVGSCLIVTVLGFAIYQNQVQNNRLSAKSASLVNSKNNTLPENTNSNNSLSSQNPSSTNQNNSSASDTKTPTNNLPSGGATSPTTSTTQSTTSPAAKITTPPSTSTSTPVATSNNVPTPPPAGDSLPSLNTQPSIITPPSTTPPPPSPTTPLDPTATSPPPTPSTTNTPAI